jgi:inner membrane transporter RhtA
MTLAAIATVQLGSSIAKNLFGAVGPLGLVWLRVTMAGLILAIAVRPRWRGHSRHDWLVLAGYSLALVAMNFTFYQAISRIPISIAVTIEFLGPLSVAVLKSRGARDLIWVGLAGLGVVLLGGAPQSLTWAGVAFALAAAACWAGYILVAPKVGAVWRGAEPVAWANIFGAVVLTIPMLTIDGSRLGHLWIWGAGAAVGLLSSVAPYALELKALRTLDQRIFSILMSLEPAVAAVFALIIVGERLTPTELAAMACVIVASIGVTWSAGWAARHHGAASEKTTPVR